MTSEVILLKELNEIGQLKALKDVAFGQLRLFLLLDNERRYMFPKANPDPVGHRIEKFAIKNHRIGAVGNWKHHRRIGVFLRSDIESILKPYFCEPGLQVIENDKAVAKALVADLSDSDVFFPWSRRPSLGNHWRVLSDISEVFETWDIYEINEFTLQDLAVAPDDNDQVRDSDLNVLFRRYKRERGVDGTYGFKDLLDFMFEKCKSKNLHGEKISWEDQTGETHSAARRNIEKKYSQWRNAKN